MVRAVLLIVDMLNDFFKEASLAEKRSALVASINDVVEIFRKNDLPVIWIRQEYEPDLSDAPLIMRSSGKRITISGTDGCEILRELSYKPSDKVVVKKRFSAFWKTDLEDILIAIHPKVIVMAGINTHACIRTTAIDAYQRDYRVVLVQDCVGSYDDEHHRMTVKYLDCGVAPTITRGELLGLLKTAG
jgi:nicotinamidase-related amidase